VFRDGLERDTVVRTACGGRASAYPVGQRGHAPVSSTSVIYRSTTNRLQIRAAWSDHGGGGGDPLPVPDDRWTPYILEYMCKHRTFYSVTSHRPRGRRDDMHPPADNSSTRGGFSSVRGRVVNPHVAKLQAASVPIA